MTLFKGDLVAAGCWAASLVLSLVWLGVGLAVAGGATLRPRRRQRWDGVRRHHSTHGENIR